MRCVQLAPLSVVTGEFLVPHGYAAGTVDVSGTLGAPRLLGEVNLQNGGFHLPFLGIDLVDVHGSVGLDGSRLTLDLDSRTGQGRAAAPPATGAPARADRMAGERVPGLTPPVRDRRS